MLDNDKVKEVLEDVGWSKIIEVVAETFIEEAEGRTVSPAKMIMDIPEYENDYRVMPSCMLKYPYCGTKIISANSGNRKRGLPLAIGSYILNDVITQESLLCCRAEEITAYRTAAATAVAVDELSREDSKILGIIGVGKQAYYHIPAILSVRKGIEKIYVNDINERNIDWDVLQNFPVKVYGTHKEILLKESDIVVTLTPTREPHIFKEDIDFDREMMIAAVGGDSEHKIEIHEEVLPMVDHFSDSYLQVSHTGIVHRAIKDGLMKIGDLKSLGDYMIGKAGIYEGKKVKMYLSTGVALQDLAMSRLIYENIGKYL